MQAEDVVDAMGAAVLDQLHHQLVVADAEVAEAAQPRARIHQVVQQHPALRRQDVVAAVLRGIGLVDRGHHAGVHHREASGAAVMVVHHTRRRRSLGMDDVVSGAFGVAQRLRLMVVEGQVHAGDVRQVGADVPVRDGDLAILHVLGVHKLDVVDQPQFGQQHGTDQAIKVTAGDEAKGGGNGVSHGGWPAEYLQYTAYRRLCEQL